MSVTSEGVEKNTTLGLDILIQPHTLSEEKTFHSAVWQNSFECSNLDNCAILNHWIHDFRCTSRELGLSKHTCNLCTGADKFKFWPGMTILRYLQLSSIPQANARPVHWKTTRLHRQFFQTFETKFPSNALIPKFLPFFCAIYRNKEFLQHSVCLRITLPIFSVQYNSSVHNRDKISRVLVTYKMTLSLWRSEKPLWCLLSLKSI